MKKTVIQNIRKSKWFRQGTLALTVTFLYQILFPAVVLASGGGTNQGDNVGPAANLNELVNLSTGDFSYSIPLMDIGGYPLNLNYSSGVTMEQEASWVGLGWTLNPGAVNRSKRGLPDDFNGEDKIEQSVNVKDHNIYGASLKASYELFGYGNVGHGRGIFYDSYKGIGLENIVSLSFSASKSVSGGSAKGSATVGVNMTGNSQNGLSIDPYIGVSGSGGASYGSSGISGNAKATLGTSYNTRQGLTGWNYSVTKSNTVSTQILGKNRSYSKSFGASNYIPFGTQSYLPSIKYAMDLEFFGGNLSAGGEIYGNYIEGDMTGYISRQSLRENHTEQAAVGYLYSENATNNLEMLHDFNRELEGPYTDNTPNLPLSGNTFDVFTATASDLGVSFRPHRNDVGMVHDNYVKETTVKRNGGADAGFGSYFKLGVNLSNVTTDKVTGPWRSENYMTNSVQFTENVSAVNALSEHVYFRSLNDQAPVAVDALNELKNESPIRQNIVEDQGTIKGKNNFVYSTTGSQNTSTLNSASNLSLEDFRNEDRVKRNESISFLTHNEVKDHDLYPTTYDYTNTPFLFNGFEKAETFKNGKRNLDTRSGAKGHHLGQIEVVKQGGKRYIYGIPVYNKKEVEVTFNLDASQSVAEKKDNLVKYVHGTDDSYQNTQGIDNFYLKREIPPYPTQFLLSYVLGANYVDRTGDGPTRDDFGDYVKFNYSKIADNYKYRQPMKEPESGKSFAYHNENMQSLGNDNKAAYFYGEREIWNVHSIESKNYIAEFHLSNREDHIGVQSNGTLDKSIRHKKLDKIVLYNALDRHKYGPDAVPIKTAHFRYDYSLCDGVPNNTKDIVNDPVKNVSVNTGSEQGKLTLKNVFFTYGNSSKSKFNNYSFEYAHNPQFEYSASDRWGSFRPKSQNLLHNWDHTYSNQDKLLADENAAAWNLSTINLPSGSSMEIDYEADDYAYVQHKKAGIMTKVLGFYDTQENDLTNNAYENNFRLPQVRGNNVLAVDLSQYDGLSDFDAVAKLNEAVKGLSKLYFRVAMRITDQRFERVTGYAKISKTSIVTDKNNIRRYLIHLVPTGIEDDRNAGSINPITKATWQLTRSHLYSLPFPGSEPGGSSWSDIVQSMEQQFEDIKILLQGINTVLLMKEVGDEIKPDNSFVRLFLTEEAKIGGGHRVKRIRVNDAWKKMSANDVDTYYGQVFTYKTKDYDGTSISSGVASYEPTNGGDEISLREPVDYSVERFFYANDYKFQETPFGEMFYPNPQVVYSKVKVEDLPWTNDSDDPNDPDKIGGSVKELVTESKTGFTIYEYYTAKEFPVYGYRTSIDDESKERDGWDQFFDYKKETYKNLGVSQGYSFVVNDMHGKLKSITTYPESSDGENKSLSSVVYHYRSEVLDHDQIKAPFKIYKLVNQVEVVNTKGEISKNGNTIKSVLGESIDLTYDTHKGVVNSRAINHQFNGDFMPGPFAIPLPVVSYFKNESEHTERFMRSVFTKLVTRTGILKSVEAQDMGAVSITENLKYDSETGAVLLSKTHNSYNDPVYHFNYPAHWIYEEMDMASKNHGLRIKTDDLVQVYTNTNARPISNYPGHSLKTPELFNCGDEVLIKNNTKSEVKKAWVNCGCEKYLVDINGKSLTQLPNDPNQHLSVDFIGLTNTSQDELELIVLRSGNRNSQNVPVSSIASKDDPTSVISSGNPLNEVLSSSHQDFKDNWRTYGVYRDQYSIESNCKYNTPCADEYLYPKGELVYNPYTTGVRGNWYPYKGYYFKENISSGGKNRTNGRYTLIPYWKYSSNNGWVKNSATGMDKWKSTGEVDAIGPNGVAYQIKSVDDRYSSSLQGYNRATIANAVNAKKEEIINLNFEDQEYRELGDRNGDYCFDPHDPIEYEVLTKSHYSEDFAHTGKYSMKIGAETAFKTNLAFEFDESTDPMICPNILLNYDNLIRPYRVSNRKHVINFWIKVGVDHIKSGNALYQYDLSQIEVKLENCDAPAGSVGDYLDEDGDGNVDSYRTTRIVEGWQQIQYVFDASNKIHGKSLKFQIINNSNEDIYIDDIRFHPFDANMTTSVYDPLTMRLVAQMDSENFTVFYDYDESGNMIRARRETEEGIYTINESRFSVVKKDL